MKLSYTIISVISLSIISLVTQCDDLLPCGQDHNMHTSYKIEYEFGDTLTYRSSTNETTKYILSYFMSGDFLRSQTGESSSGCYGEYEFEYIGISSIDSSHCSRNTIDTLINYGENIPTIECSNYLKIYKWMDSNPIDEDDARLDDPIINWKDKWESNISDHDSFHSKFALNQIEYSKVYIFETEFEDNGKTITKIYYNYKQGFIGYMTQNGVLWNLLIEAF